MSNLVDVPPEGLIHDLTMALSQSCGMLRTLARLEKGYIREW